ncbi:DNA cytosine methyltransferase [Nodosilinea sp. LEGE 06152]|nr:DNA cytosine methyltransferase [Nodosilinea sp. LEGE 06152]
MTLGFCQAGGIPVAAVDCDHQFITTYRQMFPICQEASCNDIEKWHPSSAIDQVDVIIGGPPCQGFSLARGLRFVDDPRNQLYKHFIRLVDHFQPPWIVMENVQGITNIGGGVVLQQIYEDFRKIGYELDCKVINMADYGVPQSRKRAIFVGNRLGISFKWPDANHASSKKVLSSKRTNQLSLIELNKPYISVFDALSDLPWPMGNYFSHRANSQMRGPRNRNIYTDPAFTLRIRGDEFAICEFPADGAFSPGPVPEVEFCYRLTSNPFQELMREAPPQWIQNFKKAPVVNRPIEKLIGTRRLSVREQARLQSFPDWFEFSGNPYAQGKQIGNAVPPFFAKQLFSAIFAHLNKPKERQSFIRKSSKTVLYQQSVSSV